MQPNRPQNPEQRDRMSAAVCDIFKLGGLIGVEIGMSVHRAVMHKPAEPEV